MSRWTIALLVVALESAACAYHNPAAPTPAAVDLTAASKLSLDAATGSGRTAGTATITATVTNGNGLGLGALAVGFTVDVGTLPASALTDAAGIAVVTLTGTPGPARITARVGSLVMSTLVSIQPPSTPPPGGCLIAQCLPSAPPPGTAPAPFVITLLATRALAGASTTFGLSSTIGVTSATWIFGDPSSTTDNSVTTNGPNTAHVYAHAGVYQASVVAQDALGRSASSVATVTIQNAPLPPVTPPSSMSASMTCTPATHGSPSMCNVQAGYGGAVLHSAAITNVAWDWGDGGTDSTTTPIDVHTYVNAGTYPIFALVTATTVDGPKTATASTNLIVP